MSLSPALADQHINSAQHGALSERVAHSGKCPSPIVALDAPELGGVSNHAGDLPAESVRLLVVAGELVGCVYEGADGTNAVRIARARIALAAIRSDGLEAPQAALAVGDDRTCIG